MAEKNVVVPVLPQHDPGETEGNAGLGRAGVELPKIRREKPRPTERLARRDHVNRDRFAIGMAFLKCHRPDFDKVKPVGWFARAKDYLAPIEVRGHGALGQNFEMGRSHAAQEWMRGYTLLHGPAGTFTALLALHSLTYFHDKTFGETAPRCSSQIGEDSSFFAHVPSATKQRNSCTKKSKKRPEPWRRAVSLKSSLTNHMDYLVVLLTAAFVAAYAFIVGRRLPRE
jgi:hypothetical protein